MLQYLLNTTIIWLAFLLAYELLLRKEKYYQHNRIYLVAAIVIGLVLPLVKIDIAAQYNDSQPKTMPAREMYELKRTLQISPSTPAVSGKEAGAAGNSSFGTENLLWSIYLLGAIAMLGLMLYQSVQLVRLYRKGKKSYHEGSIVIETGTTDVTFSFFNMIFVSDSGNYSPGEWKMLMTHEQVHSRQHHTIDNLLLILLRIVFWFHPLSYIFYNRLRMVHEFQADETAAKLSPDYGNFLLEQSLLRSAPLLAHSFNRSPVKTRLAMLASTTRPRTRLLKYLVAIPLMTVLLFLCTQSSFSEAIKRNGNTVYFKGNEITLNAIKIIPDGYRETLREQKKILPFLSLSLPDSVAVRDWRTSTVSMVKVQSDTIPVALNGRPVFGNEKIYLIPDADTAYAAAVFSGEEKDLDTHIFKELKNDLSQLDDGEYVIALSNIIIDEQGKIAYYEYSGVQPFMSRPENGYTLSNELRSSINNKIAGIMNSPLTFRPAQKDNKPINVRFTPAGYIVLVKGHVATLQERGGC